jgi:ribosomal protein S12 methylthiotransferase accessory factor
MAATAEARPSAISPGVVDARCGIVRRCLELPLEADDPRVFCVVSEAAETVTADPGAPRQSRYGCGMGLTRQDARAAAAGEIVEGYAAAVCPPELIVHASFDELDEAAVAPEAFALFSPAQHAAFTASPPPGLPPFRPFTRAARTGWVHGFDLAARRVVLVPAPFVYLPYRYGPGEPYVADNLSTGLACARSRDEAALRGLCEVVERDALSIAWQNRLSLPRIDLEAGDALGRLFRESFACRGTRWTLLDATLDIAIPTVVAVLEDERGGAAVGSACRADPFDAARKALLEAAQCRVAWKRDLVLGSPRTYAADFHDVVDFGDHGRLYTHREMRPHLAFLAGGGPPRRVAELPSADRGSVAATLAHCVDLLRGRGLAPIALDLTTDDVREAGYHVVRVVIPGMEALNARHAAPFRGGRRLREVPMSLGLRASPATDAELNPLPHPFP